jgi:hypothetical protein
VKTTDRGSDRASDGPVAIAMRILPLAALAGCLALGGCAGLPGGGPAREAPATAGPTAAPVVYFSGVEGLTVHGQPRSSAPVLGSLPLHEKVYRDRIERGYAHVRVEGSGLVGWVDNAKLIWRLPATPAAASPAPEAAPSVTPAPTPPPSREIPAEGSGPEASSPPRPSSKGTASPSIFDPY